MIEKEYYRFDELKHRFSMSTSDVRYIVESLKVELVFYLERNKFIIGGWIKDKGFSGFCSVSYRGLAKISQDEQLKIVADKKVIVKNFRLLNKEMISAPNIEYPFESELPNQFLHSWEPRPLNKISWRTVPAKLFPKEQEHSYRTLKKGLDEVVSAFTGKEQVDSEKTSALLDRLPKKEFYSAGITLSMNDICLLHSDLVLLNIIQSSDENIILKDKHYESQILKKTITFDNMPMQITQE